MKKKRCCKMISLLFAILLGILFSCSIAPNHFVQATTKKDKIQTVKDLKGKKIGVQEGTTGDIYITDYAGEKTNKGTTVSRFDKGADAIQALKQKKVDCVIIDEQPAKEFVLRNSDLKILKEEFVKESYAICIAKKNISLRDKINGALDELQKEGTLDKIKKNYIGDSTKGKYKYTSPAGLSYTNGTLTMATNAEFPPYEYYQGDKPTGLDVDMAHAVADKLHMKLKISDMKFDSIITAVQSGKADVGIAGMTVTADRMKNVNFSKKYTTSKQVIIVPSGKKAHTMNLQEKFYQNFLKDSRWVYLANGLKNTIIITFFAALIGIILGFLIALIRVAHDKNDSLKLLNAICKLYLTIVRGTPMVVQLLIIYYVIFAAWDINKIFVAIIAFGLNSAAYVAEVVRSGITSIDNGQFEAGRSLGLTFGQTMTVIILPQAFKNVLPALGNEYIALIKETSISGYIGLQDLTKGGDIIRSMTWEAFFPLIAVALIYLLIVMLMTAGVTKLERRLKKNER